MCVVLLPLLAQYVYLLFNIYCVFMFALICARAHHLSLRFCIFLLNSRRTRNTKGYHTGTMLTSLAPMQLLLTHLHGGTKGVRLSMAKFGARSPRTILTWGSWPGLLTLKQKRYKTKKAPERPRSKSDRKSSAHPAEFGKAIANRFQQETRGLCHTTFHDDDQCWAHAKKVLLEQVFPSVEMDEREEVTGMFLEWTATMQFRRNRTMFRSYRIGLLGSPLRPSYQYTEPLSRVFLSCSIFQALHTHCAEPIPKSLSCF